MEEKEDLRVRRTKKLLSFALLDIMEDTPFNKISVNDICEKAMVHRATFYNHFYDKEDLFNYILGEIQEEMFNKSIESGTFTSSKEMYMDLIVRVLNFISDNRQRITKIVNKNSYEKMLLLIAETIKRSIKYLLVKNKFKEEYTIPVDVLANFFTGGLTVIGYNFLTDETKYTKEQILGFCDVLLNEQTYIKK